MATVTVHRTFWDREAGANRVAGESFEATTARAAEIDAALPGYVSVTEKAAQKKAPARRRTAKPKE